MRVLIFSTAYFPHVGGAEVAVKEITDRIGDVYFDMITIRLNRKDRPHEKIENINVYRIGWGFGRVDKLLFPFRASRLASTLHNKHAYQIAWSVMASFSGFAALFFKKKHTEVKFLLTLQEGDDLREPVRKSMIVHGWFKQIFTKANYVQCISHYLADWAKKMGATCPVEVVPNGISMNVELRITNYELRKQLGISSKEKVILTTSRLVKKNGVADLINAIQMLVTSYQLPVTLVICGTGELENTLKDLIKKLNITDKVVFQGFVKPEELSEYYAAADVFCRPSLTEGLGNSFLEAMAYDVPVVATPVGGIPDFLHDGKTGWFCKVNDPQSIAEKVAYILDKKNANEVRVVVKNARHMVEQKYNWETIARQMHTIFSKLNQAT